jgi:hypothetical protein
MREAVLSSNNGSHALRLALLNPAKWHDDAGFDAELRLDHAHWDGEHPHAGSTWVPGLWLNAGALRELREQILGYVDLPLAQLARAVFTGTFELAGQAGQSLRLHFGPRADLVHGPLPALGIDVCEGTFSAHLHFVTDQSCMRIFAEGLGVAD